MGAGELDAYVVKTDSLGNIVWEKTYGGSGYDEGRRIVTKPGGGYMILANTDSQISGEFNYYLISADVNGDTLWTETMGKTGGTDRCFDILNISENQYLLAGTTFDDVEFGQATLTVVQDDSAPTGVVEGNKISGYHLYDAYPNPFNPSTVIKYSIGNSVATNQGNQITSLIIYDVLGNEIAVLVNENQASGEYEVKFNATGLASGLYFYQLQSGNFVQTKKFILLK